MIVDSMWILREAVTVTLTSPLSPTLPTVVVAEKGSAEYWVIFPIVGFEDLSTKTWRAPERNQFWRIAWSSSADVTSRDILCG